MKFIIKAALNLSSLLCRVAEFFRAKAVAAQRKRLDALRKQEEQVKADQNRKVSEEFKRHHRAIRGIREDSCTKNFKLIEQCQKCDDNIRDLDKL